MNETVSVVVPTHSRPQFLCRAVDSLLAQTYPNVEIVVVDDNEPSSPAREQTQSLMAEYTDRYDNVVYVRNPHSLGGGPARNAGINACTGDFVTFLDDDDVYLPRKIELQLGYMLENGLDFSFTDVYLYSEDDRPVEYRRYTYVTDFSHSELKKQHILHSLGPTSTFMIRRSVLKDTGFRDVSMGQDFFLFWDLLDRDIKIGYLPGSQIKQYLHNSERISLGKNKVEGEKRLYKLKQTGFDLLNASERRYVHFRHFAVLAVANKRSGSPVKALACGARAVLISPGFFCKEVVNLLNNRKLCLNEEEGEAKC